MNQKKLPSIKKKTGEIKLVQPSMKVQLSDKNNNNANTSANTNTNNMNLFTNSNSKNKTNIATSQVISKSIKKDNINSKISTSTSTVIPKSNFDDRQLKDKKQSKLSETIKSSNNSHFNKLKDSKLNMINVTNMSVSDNINLNDLENIKMDDNSNVIKPSFNNNIRPHNNEFSEDSFMTIKLKDISALDFKNNPKLVKDKIANIHDSNSNNKDNDKDNELNTLNKSPDYNFDETINFNINVNKSKSSNIKYIGNYPDSSNNFSLEDSNVNKSLMSQTFSGFPNNSVLEELNKQNHNNYKENDNNIPKYNNNISNLISNSLNKSHNVMNKSQVNHTQLNSKINNNNISSNNNNNNNYMNNSSVNNITSQFNNNTTRFSPENREILNPGDLIYEDKIKIIELLGKGAQAHVYLGEIIELNKNIAIKRYCIYDIKSNELNKIIEECETFKKLDHPHILKYYDLEYFYHELENLTEINLIMDYVEGSTLREYMDLTKDNCDINNIKIIGRCILEGLAYLHENGVLHRDLKPDNILISYDLLEIKIADFGISTKIKQSETIKKRTLVGTPSYMSPEIICEKPYEKDADIWAFGCILYELVGGEKPFKDIDPIQLMIKITQFSNPLECASETVQDIIYDKKNRNILKILQQCWKSNNLFRPSANELLENSLFSFDDE